jgi:hypothetical protein
MKHSDIRSFFDAVKDLNYLVIRNYWELTDTVTTDEHKDIDILCEDREAFIQKAGLERNPVFFDKVHYLACIGQKKVPVDLRDYRDGYFCRPWAEDILKNRTALEDLCYAMDNKNLFYSIIYHCVVQKGKISDSYFRQIKDLGEGLGIEVTTKENARDILVKFMEDNHYYIQKPEDPLLKIHAEELPASLDKRTAADKLGSRIEYILHLIRVHVMRIFKSR